MSFSFYFQLTRYYRGTLNFLALTLGLVTFSQSLWDHCIGIPLFYSTLFSIAVSFSRSDKFCFLFIVGRGVLTTFFYDDPPILPTPLFQIFSNPSFFVASNPQSHCSLCCLVSLVEWVTAPRLMCYFNDIMDLHMLSLDTLVPEGLWCVFYATRFQVYWALTHNAFFSGTLFWYHTHKHTHTHTNTHSTLRGQ